MDTPKEVHLSSFYSFSQQKPANQLHNYKNGEFIDLDNAFKGEDHSSTTEKTLEKRNSFGNLLGKTKSRKKQYQLISNPETNSKSELAKETPGLPPRSAHPSNSNLNRIQSFQNFEMSLPLEKQNSTIKGEQEAKENDIN